MQIFVKGKSWSVWIIMDPVGVRKVENRSEVSSGFWRLRSSCRWAQVWGGTPQGAVTMGTGLCCVGCRGWVYHPVERPELIRGNKLLHESAWFPRPCIFEAMRLSDFNRSVSSTLKPHSSWSDLENMISVCDNQSSLVAEQCCEMTPILSSLVMSFISSDEHDRWECIHNLLWLSYALISVCS